MIFNCLFLFQIPKLLDGSFPMPSAETFIYVIKTENMTSRNAEIGDKYLGFCTTKKLPKVSTVISLLLKKMNLHDSSVV